MCWVEGEAAADRNQGERAFVRLTDEPQVAKDASIPRPATARFGAVTTERMDLPQARLPCAPYPKVRNPLQRMDLFDIADNVAEGDQRDDLERVEGCQPGIDTKLLEQMRIPGINDPKKRVLECRVILAKDVGHPILLCEGFALGRPPLQDPFGSGDVIHRAGLGRMATIDAE